MSVITKDLGAVTAYAAAVNRGYTGTKEEFETLMASYATVAQQAAESAQSAEQSAQSASGSATDAQTAQGTAQQAATDAQTAQASAQGYAQSAQQSAQSASQYAQSAESAKDTAVDAVDGFASGAQQALESVNSAGINWKSLAEAQKLDSEAWAVGQRDGEDVGTQDETYHNNAKYYAESAATDATTASEAAQTATTKAGEAAQSASQAAESARTLTIDATLTKSGQAADSKATGAAIAELKNDLTVFTGNTKISFVLGKYIATNGSTADITALMNNSKSSVAVVPCSAGEKFTINAQGGTVGKTWAFVDADGTVLSVVADNNPVHAVITAPQNATHLIINDANPVTGYSYVGESLNSIVGSIETTVTDAIEKRSNGNLYISSDIEKYTGYYYYRSGVNLVKAVNASYSCFIVPVMKNSIYSCSISSINLLNEQKKPINTTGSWDFQDVDIFNSGSASYVAVSFNHTVIAEADYVFSFGTFLDASAFYDFYTLKKESNKPSVIAKNTATLTANGTVTIKGKSAIKDGMTIMFKGFLSAFSGIRLTFDGGSSSNYIEINATNLIVNADTGVAQTAEHGLSIANDVTLLAVFDRGKVEVTIESNGYIYKSNPIAWYQTGGTITEHTILSLNGTTCSSSVFVIIYDCARRDVWYFGDSYIEFNNDTRLPYYLIQYGYDKNALFSGASGCGSSVTYQALDTLRQHGFPKYAVFATGMNDGSDSSDAPSTSWATALTKFINLCEALGIIPVLCTVPTVPTVNNEQKNAYVKASGHRYIDYAKAVGAQADGTWYAGMLSSDNVHPSEYGAKALFTQLLIDLPEITTEQSNR